jgi:hypothetical protein
LASGLGKAFAGGYYQNSHQKQTFITRTKRQASMGKARMAIAIAPTRNCYKYVLLLCMLVTYVACQCFVATNDNLLHTNIVLLHHHISML